MNLLQKMGLGIALVSVVSSSFAAVEAVPTAPAADVPIAIDAAQPVADAAVGAPLDAQNAVSADMSPYARGIGAENPYAREDAMVSSVGPVVMVIYLVVYLFFAYCQMVLAQKMGVSNTWMAFIPLLNVYQLLKMGGKPGWWIILMCIPFVNIYFVFSMYHGISKARGYGAGMTLGLIFLTIIFLPYLAFSEGKTPVIEDSAL